MRKNVAATETEEINGRPFYIPVGWAVLRLISAKLKSVYSLVCLSPLTGALKPLCC